MAKIILKNGLVVSSTGIEKLDILIKDGKISEVVRGFTGEAEQEIDCSGKYILPGLIDAHVHFRAPGGEQKEDFETGSKAAAAGGVTTVLDMPNTRPPLLTVELLEEKRAMAKGRFYVNYGFYFGISKDNLAEAEKAEGVPGLKVFMGSSTGNMLVDDENVLDKVFALGKLVVVHAEDEALIKANLEKYKDFQGPEKHNLIRSPEAAYRAVKKALHLAKKHNTRLHIAHVSTKMELEEIRKFKTEKISCEATPHHLFLTEKDYFKQGHFVKMNPPVRKEEDQEALWQGIKSGVIDMIATDHAPHLKEEKERKYEEAPSGVPGVETMLPLLLDKVNKAELNLEDIARMTAKNPAKKFNIKNKGEIKEGFDADLVIVDMEKEQEVKNENLFTKCGWSPFNGWKLKGWPVMTVVNGEIVMREGKIAGGKEGREVETGGRLSAFAEATADK